MCGCLSCSPQPRHVPLLGIEPGNWTCNPLGLWFAGSCSVHWAIPARARLWRFYSSFSHSFFTCLVFAFILPLIFFVLFIFPVFLWISPFPSFQLEWFLGELVDETCMRKASLQIWTKSPHSAIKPPELSFSPVMFSCVTPPQTNSLCRAAKNRSELCLPFTLPGGLYSVSVSYVCGGLFAGDWETCQSLRSYRVTGPYHSLCSLSCLVLPLTI